MSNHQTPAVLTGRMIGVYRLKVLISALKLEVQGLKGRSNAYTTLKRELGCRGSRESVLNYAAEVLENVRNW